MATKLFAHSFPKTIQPMTNYKNCFSHRMSILQGGGGYSYFLLPDY